MSFTNVINFLNAVKAQEQSRPKASGDVERDMRILNVIRHGMRLLTDLPFLTQLSPEDLVPVVTRLQVAGQVQILEDKSGIKYLGPTFQGHERLNTLNDHYRPA